MARKTKKPTITELRKQVRDDLKHWNQVYKKGATDPFHEDGINLYLIRNHIHYDREQLRKRCKEDKIRPCPEESRVKLPREVGWTYCAPRSKAGPCKERRKRTAARKRRKKKGRRRTRKKR